MGWEKRKGSSGRYYTRSRRVRGRVRREYIGCGETAYLLAEMDAAAREGRLAQREIAAERRREERARHDAMYAAILGPVDALGVVSQVAMRRELEAAGYHQHDRGEWRKRRGEKRTATERARTHNDAKAGRRYTGSGEAARASAECGRRGSANAPEMDPQGPEGAGGTGV